MNTNFSQNEALAHQDDEAEAATTAIYDDPLEVSARSGWQAVGEPLEAKEYQILLCTGGPAVRVIGDLKEGEPATAYLEYQDWGTYWVEYVEADKEILLVYARCFDFNR